MKIETSSGTKRIVKTCYPYHQDSAGQWWTVNPQTGWVPVLSNSRALIDTIDRAYRAQR